VQIIYAVERMDILLKALNPGGSSGRLPKDFLVL
jgi:hypothetical protein